MRDGHVDIDPGAGSRWSTSRWVGVLVLVGCGAPPDGDGTLGVLDEEMTVCPAGPTVKGVDVSVYQGNIDWPTARATGLEFAIARISDGTFLDTKFAQNWTGMQAVGLVRGAYQFFEPAGDPNVQANIVIQHVGRLGAGDLPVTADMEVTGGQTAATIAGHLATWISAVEQGTGKAPMIYTSPGFWNANVHSNAFVNNPLWVAHWFVNCPNLPPPWTAFAFWQHSDMGSVNGIPAVVDLDVFNGDVNALRAFAGNSPAYAAKYVAQSFPLATSALVMATGQTVPAYLELRNVGTATWDGNTRLATSNPRDRMSVFASPKWPSGNRLAQVSGMIAPGQSFRFQFDFQAPQQTGTYFEYFNLVQDGVAWFSDAGQGGPPDNQIEAQIQVVQPDWGAQLVAQSFPPADKAALTIASGDSADGWFDFKNIGTRTWKAGVTKLAPTPRDQPSPLADGSWSSPTRISTIAMDVPPGATGRFAARLHAPAVGDYSQTFNLVEDGVAWFSDPPPTAGVPPDDFVRVHVVVVPPRQVGDGGAKDAGTGQIDGGAGDGGAGDGGGPGLSLNGGCKCAMGRSSGDGDGGASVMIAGVCLALWWRRRIRA